MAVPRAYQVDAVDLDSECYQLFKSQYRQASAHLPGGFLDKIEPEISALLDVAVHVVPLITSSALIGQQILGTQFINNASRKIPRKWFLYGLTIVGTRWLAERWKIISALMLPESSLPLVNISIQQKKAKYPYIQYRLFYFLQADQLMDSVKLFLKAANLLNSLVFLKQGVYPTLTHRVLRLHTRMQAPDQPKSADLSILTRELLWHSFADLLMFTLPLVNVHRLKRWLLSWQSRNQHNGIPTAFEINSSCASCIEAPVIPQRAPCNHVFCYYCLKANLAADPQFLCPLCGAPAES